MQGSICGMLQLFQAFQKTMASSLWNPVWKQRFIFDLLYDLCIII